MERGQLRRCNKSLEGESKSCGESFRRVVLGPVAKELAACEFQTCYGNTWRIAVYPLFEWEYPKHLSHPCIISICWAYMRQIPSVFSSQVFILREIVLDNSIKWAPSATEPYLDGKNLNLKLELGMRFLKSLEGVSIFCLTEDVNNLCHEAEAWMTNHGHKLFETLPIERWHLRYSL